MQNNRRKFACNSQLGVIIKKQLIKFRHIDG